MIIQEINEKNFEKIIEQDKHIVEDKFSQIKSFEDCSSGEKEAQEKWGRLMQDPTCFAYAYFQDPEGNSLKLYPFQDRFINDKHRFVLCVAANQIGKTLALCIKALHHACYVPNAFVLIVSRSEDQATHILDQIKNFMRFAPNYSFDEIKDEVDNRTELHIKSKKGSGIAVIKCIPPTSSVLGYRATLIILDEVGFWEIKTIDDTKYFYQYLETRTNSTKDWKHEFLTMGQIIAISNPNGQQGLLWNLWQNDKRFHKYRFCWLAKPTNKLDGYLEKKDNLPSDVFDSSYAAVFNSAAGGFITQKELDDACKTEHLFKINKDEPFFLGGDFTGDDTYTRDIDLSVLYGVQKTEDGEIKIVYCKEFEPRTPKTEICEEIKRLNETYNIQLFAYDKIGVSDSILNYLIDNNILTEEQIEPLTYSLPQKSSVYSNLKLLFEQRSIKIPNFDGLNQLKEQLMNLKFVKTSSGHLKIHGAGKVIIKSGRAEFKEEKHDDHADAFANACYAARLETSSPSAKWV